MFSFATCYVPPDTALNFAQDQPRMSFFYCMQPCSTMFKTFPTWWGCLVVALRWRLLPLPSPALKLRRRWRPCIASRHISVHVSNDTSVMLWLRHSITPTQELAQLGSKLLCCNLRGRGGGDGDLMGGCTAKKGTCQVLTDRATRAWNAAHTRGTAT
jgi:hypothetical protein